jgi:hypothetical protein
MNAKRIKTLKGNAIEYTTECLYSDNYDKIGVMIIYEVWLYRKHPNIKIDDLIKVERCDLIYNCQVLDIINDTVLIVWEF